RRGIDIEIRPRTGDAFDMLTRMGAQQFVVGSRLGHAPLPIGMTLLDHWRGARDAIRPFRMAGTGIFQAVWIVKNPHLLARRTIEFVLKTWSGKSSISAIGLAIPVE